jgi:Fic family protein
LWVKVKHVEVERFRNSPIGRVVPISGSDGRFGETYEHWAFVPKALLNEVELSPSARDVVFEAALALGRLDQAGRQIPNPVLLRRPTLRREAQSTSALEGTYAPLSDVFGAEDGGGAKTPELREILNYVAAAEYAYQWVRDRGRITRDLICDLHALLMSGSELDVAQAGMVRNIQVVIGSGGRVQDARFVPVPPGPNLEAGFTDLLDWIDRPRERSVQAVVDSALAHYQFETLHPFHDGNGRIGRLLIVLQLLSAGVLGEPLLAVSPWFEARRAQYQDELQHMSMTGDVDRWVSFFCEGIRAQAQATVEKITDLLAFQEEAILTVRETGRHSVAVDIAGDLVERPVLNVANTASRYQVSFVSANKAVAKLVDVGLLAEITGRGHDRVFRCDRVLRILER